MSAQALQRLQAVRKDLRSRFIERDALIDGVLIGVLSRQHVLMLGPPGTAKSMLAKEVCRRLGGKRYFEWLLTKFTTPEELFGPVSIAALEEGRYERVTAGKLPEAEVVFLDEVFKASSAILNALLTIMNERRFYHGNRPVAVPLDILLSASNELPDEDELAALYDRFLLRYTVGYVEHDHHFADLLRAPLPDDPGAPPPVALEGADLTELQARTARVEVPPEAIADLTEIRRKLGEEGVIASDRRYRLALGVLRASALLEGRDRVKTSDLLRLEHVLWSDPEERPAVKRVLSALATGLEEEAGKLLRQAQEIDAFARREWADSLSQSRAVLEAHTKLEDLLRRLTRLRDQGAARGRDASLLDEAVTSVSTMQARLLRDKH